MIRAVPNHEVNTANLNKHLHCRPYQDNSLFEYYELNEAIKVFYIMMMILHI